MVEVEASARRLAVSIQERTVEQSSIEGLLAFATRGCAEEFGRCFEVRGWPAMETLDMLADWRSEQTTRIGGVHLLIQWVEQGFQDGYYQLRS